MAKMDNMIKINEKYGISISTHGMELMKYQRSEVFKDGKPTGEFSYAWKVAGYYTRFDDLATKCINLEMNKEKVKDTVPPRIFQHNESFWICPTCDKIYWAGTHYENILETMRQLTKK